MKNKPPHIEYHLRNEEEDLMTVQNLSLCLSVITTGCHEGRVKACSQHMIGTELDSCHQYGSPWSIGIAKAIFTGWMLLLTTSISDRALVGSVNTLYWKLCKCIWSDDWLSLIWAHFASEMSVWMWCAHMIICLPLRTPKYSWNLP